MASGALFGSTGRSQSKNLVEFRAGKMFMKGKMVHPDKRKGMVYVYQSDDALMHFCWKDRTTGNVEDVSILICHLIPNFLWWFISQILVLIWILSVLLKIIMYFTKESAHNFYDLNF